MRQGMRLLRVRLPSTSGLFQLCMGLGGALHARRRRAVTKTIFDVHAPCGLPDPAGTYKALREACVAHLRALLGAWGS